MSQEKIAQNRCKKKETREKSEPTCSKRRKRAVSNVWGTYSRSSRELNSQYIEQVGPVWSINKWQVVTGKWTGDWIRIKCILKSDLIDSIPACLQIGENAFGDEQSGRAPLQARAVGTLEQRPAGVQELEVPQVGAEEAIVVRSGRVYTIMDANNVWV